jgi:uncharacterized membrane protein YdjX (TVP38/TMEM64 family)
MKKTSRLAGFVRRASEHPMLAIVPMSLLLVVVLVVVFRREIWGIFASPERIERAVESWGIWAPIAFILLQILQVVVFVIPGEIPQIAGGFLFGLFGGALYSVVGILIGSSLNFMLARLLGVPFVRALFNERQIRSFEGIAHSPRAQIGFFLLFVIPGIPKDILCYVAGLSPLRFGAFLVISTVGRLPGIVGSAAMGNAAASKEWLLAIVLFSAAVVLFLLGLVFRQRIHSFIERFALRPAPNLREKRSADQPAPGESTDI